MATTHIVAQGEDLTNIARKFGFASFRIIYDAPENAEFRKLRPNPDLIFPGDKLVIPDVQPLTVTAPTGQATTIIIPFDRTRLKIQLANFQDEAQKGIAFKLKVGGLEIEGESKDGGQIDEEIPADAATGTLELPAFDLRWNLVLGGLDPIETVSGVQGRLNNLGFSCGPVDGINGPKTKAGVKAFQRDNPPLVVDGICGKKTRAVLLEKYGF